MVLDISLKAFPMRPAAEPLAVGLLPRPKDNPEKSSFTAHPPPNPLPSREGEGGGGDYRWVVDVGAVAGAVVAGVAFGVPGLIIGGALAAAGFVPLRRLLAENANPKALEGEMSLGAEMAVNAGATLLFGAVFAGVAGVARIAATRISAAVAARMAAQAARRPLVQKAIEQGWRPLKENYVRWGHVPLRFAAGGVAAYDLTHDKNGKWNPADDSLDTGLGFASSIYSVNLVYSQIFGANAFGLDVAAPMSIATYQLIRVISGAKTTDLGTFNYNEAGRFRYMNEFANILQNVATYGRAYYRPDLREAIAASRGLVASMDTGALTVFPRGVSLFGWFFDSSFGAAYRVMPNAFQNVVKPTVAFETGAPKWARKLGEERAKRLTVVASFKDLKVKSADGSETVLGPDMMKPVVGPTGRVLSLAQVWGMVVPYQMYVAPQLGMKGKEWGAHRLWKFTAWPLIGNPIQASLGGDTAVAKLVGFTVGMGMDGAITLFYNPRYEKREWAWDFHQSLADFSNAKTEDEKKAIAEHVWEDIYIRQMSDWDLRSLVARGQLRKTNPAYRETFMDELEQLTPENRAAFEQILSILEKNLSR